MTPKRRASLKDRPLPPDGTPRPTDNIVLGEERERTEILLLPLDEIQPNRFQPRTQPSDGGLQELAESIRQHGVLEPVLVRQIPLTLYEGTGRSYELIAGERRWRASALAGCDTIPAIIIGDTADDRAMLELAITENLQREDLHPLDEALAFGRMQSAFGYSYAQIAERLGKSKGYVQNRMRLLQLDEDLQQLVAERPDTLAHVYELAKVTDRARRAPLIAAVRDDTLSRQETCARVQALLAPASPEPPNDRDPAYFQKYDREETHNPQPAGDTSAPQGLYSRDDDRKEQRRREAGEDRALEMMSAAVLTEQERAAVVSVTAKVDRFLGDTDSLTVADWEVLAPLALRLSDLLRKVGQRRRP